MMDSSSQPDILHESLASLARVIAEEHVKCAEDVRRINERAESAARSRYDALEDILRPIMAEREAIIHALAAVEAAKPPPPLFIPADGLTLTHWQLPQPPSEAS